MNRINRMKNTRLGKIVCRLMGEEKGAIMMEYVIVAVMIAAAVTVTAWLFGAQIMGMFQALGDYVMGRTDAGKTKIQAMQNSKPGQDAAGTTAAKDIPQSKEEELVDKKN